MGLQLIIQRLPCQPQHLGCGRQVAVSTIHSPSDMLHLHLVERWQRLLSFQNVAELVGQLIVVPWFSDEVFLIFVPIFLSPNIAANTISSNFS